MTELRFFTPRRESGLTLIELMIALALGLIIVIAVINIFIANRATFKTQEALAQVQQNARIGYELLAHDIREAGGNPCGIPFSQVANLLNSTAWWANFSDGNVRGYDGADAGTPVSVGTGAKERVAGTDAVLVRGASAACEGKDLVIADHTPGTAQFKTGADHCIYTGDILMACDLKQAAIFQASAAVSAARTINHAVGGGVSPGNCSPKLGVPASCATSTFTDYTFSKEGIISRFSSTLWFVGNNDHGGRSLFRAKPKNAAVPDPLNPGVTVPTIVMDVEEIADGVVDMQVDYLLREGGTLKSDYVVSTLVTPDKNEVVAMRIALTVNSANIAGTNAKPIERKFVHIISLRNQEIVQ